MLVDWITAGLALVLALLIILLGKAARDHGPDRCGKSDCWLCGGDEE